MSGLSVLTAALIALPVGIAIGHYGRGGILAINVSNIGRAVPSFAVLVIAVQLFGIGALPAFIALVALAIPPMVTNSYIGMREVDPDVREAARGMGMRERAVLLRRFIVDGLGLQDYPMLFAGALMVAILSLIVEFSLAGVQRLSTPAGLRPSKSSQKEGPSEIAALDTAAVAA
jgi:osmoprotectant transport system permease protein